MAKILATCRNNVSNTGPSNAENVSIWWRHHVDGDQVPIDDICKVIEIFKRIVIDLSRGGYCKWTYLIWLYDTVRQKRGQGGQEELLEGHELQHQG